MSVLKMHVSSPDMDKGAISHLFENLDLIVANKQTIISHSDYRNIKIPGIFVGGLYVGMHKLALGDLLDLWETTEWHSGNKYYFNIVGSPLSGSNYSWWFDTETKELHGGEYSNGRVGFSGLASPAIKYLQAHTLDSGQSELTIFDLVKQLKQ